MTYIFKELATALRSDPGLTGKLDINVACKRLRLNQNALGRPGDDCAVLPDGDEYLLFAMEGFINEFIAADPWFAGWCGVMVNMSDVLAMGGRPVAVTDAVWAGSSEHADAILDGMKAASEAYGIPIVGGHTNLRAQQSQLAVSILGRASQLITSFDAKPGDVLIAAIDHRGRYRPSFNNWQAALEAPHKRLRQNMELLPTLAEAGLCKAGKDISQGGIIGTSLMLAECSNVAIAIDLEQIEPPHGVDLSRWLVSFPSFGFVLSVAEENVAAVHKHFEKQDIWTGAIGTINEGSTLSIMSEGAREVIWDHRADAYLGLGNREAIYA